MLGRGGGSGKGGLRSGRRVWGKGSPLHGGDARRGTEPVGLAGPRLPSKETGSMLTQAGGSSFALFCQAQANPPPATRSVTPTWAAAPAPRPPPTHTPCPLLSLSQPPLPPAMLKTPYHPPLSSPILPPSSSVPPLPLPSSLSPATDRTPRRKLKLVIYSKGGITFTWRA